MVEVTEIKEETKVLLSKERELDADEIESLCQTYAVRTSVKAHLESLAQKIRRDANALKRLEKSQNEMEVDQIDDNDDHKEEEEERVLVEEVKTGKSQMEPIAPQTVAVPPILSQSQKYKSIDKFAFDAGSYNSPTVSIYISLPNIKSIPRENIQCDFTPTSFDLKIHDFQGGNYRLVKDNLDKDINPETSKIIVKADKIVIKLGKVKGEYGSYDSWMDLTSKKSKEDKKKMNNDPSASIMNLMKEMYDSGDDQMKKMIGETMLKQREGKLDGTGSNMGLDDI